MGSTLSSREIRLDGVGEVGTCSTTTTGECMQKGDETETGLVDQPDNALASAIALVQRVKALGLHLGDVMVSGISLGLPNASSSRGVFSTDNIEALMAGHNCIHPLPPEALQAQLDRNIVQARRMIAPRPLQ